MKNRAKEIIVIIIIVLLFFSVPSIFGSTIKYLDIYGKNFNAQRLANKLEILNNNWKVTKPKNDNFKIAWENSNKNETHTRKIITYGYFGAITEENIYDNHKNSIGNIYYSIYNFKKKEFGYYKEVCGIVAIEIKIPEKEFKEEIKK